MPSVKDLISLYSAPDSDEESEFRLTETSCGTEASESSATLHSRIRTRPVPPSIVSVEVPTSDDTETVQDSRTSDVWHETARLLGNPGSRGGDEESEALQMEDMQPGLSEYRRKRNVNTAPHTPVPATTVFARDAAPLYLPDLDLFLSKLQAPKFSRFASGVRVGKKIVGKGMFPPMDQLAATGKSIVDLETNSTVAPIWRNRESIIGGISDATLSITGSSVVATFYSLHGLIDVVQVFALICSSIIPHSKMSEVKDDWKALFLGVIPNVLALNFGATVIQSSIFLGVFLFISMVLLYCFWSATKKNVAFDAQEGFPTVEPKVHGWWLITICFLLSVLYLPLSTIVIHALVWSDDFWVVSNPYTNTTIFPPVLPPLGPSNEFHDPLDFCYTTTMKRNEVNFAPVIIIISILAFGSVTIWFPIRLHKVIKQTVPKVDRFTERGTPRSQSELDREYQRLIKRDHQPMSFLYSDFRRGWGTYKSIYLFAKLSTLAIIAVISPDNCLFRTLSRTNVSIAQKAVLSTIMLVFFLIQCFWAPFIDPVNNASEWTSRLNYLLTSLVGLAAAIDVSESDILDGPILYIIYILTYGFGIYFTCINFSWMHRIVKRLTGRMDFSIDVFSPKLDLSPSSPHIKRRTWQETITTLLLTSPECRIPKDQPMMYAGAREAEYPPYLLEFKGSPAERHVENLKILRERGLREYINGCESLDDQNWDQSSRDWIQHEYTGPDMCWIKSGSTDDPQTRFGTSWWIPFPPSLVFRYDDGGHAVLDQPEQLRTYVSMNKSRVSQKARQIRLALRALDGQIVHWPYEFREPVGNHIRICCCGRRYHARGIIKFQMGVFTIKRKGQLTWKGTNLGSGFSIELVYTKDVKVSGDVLGVTDNWELTPTLARFLAMNQALIRQRLPAVESTLAEFRKYYRRECLYKTEVLSYQFLLSVYDQPKTHEELWKWIGESEKDLRVRQLFLGATDAVIAGHERLSRAVSSQAHAWWYIFWDDLWRRNYDTIRNLRLHEPDFSPYFPTSIAYMPLPRPALEAFLTQRGLYDISKMKSNFFHPGLLNKMYFRLSEIVFHNTDQAVLLHVGEGSSELNQSAIDALAHARSSSLGTGGGTDHDDSSIRARPTYRWEGFLEDPILKESGHLGSSDWLSKVSVWLGLTPLWRSGLATRGIALDVKLENGRYVLL